MKDFRLTENEDKQFSLNISNGDFEIEDAFNSAIKMSLFTDQRATSDLIKDPNQRRGWMGDLISPVTDRKVGSLLWLLDQTRLTSDVANKAKNYCRLALKWLVEDDLAKIITVETSIVPRQGISATITINTNDGEILTYYKNLWENTSD